MSEFFMAPFGEKPMETNPSVSTWISKVIFWGVGSQKSWNLLSLSKIKWWVQLWMCEKQHKNRDNLNNTAILIDFSLSKIFLTPFQNKKSTLSSWAEGGTLADLGNWAENYQNRWRTQLKRASFINFSFDLKLKILALLWMSREITLFKKCWICYFGGFRAVLFPYLLL